MKSGALGKVYSDGEIIIRQGDKGNCMYVVQDGHVEVVKEINGLYLPLAVLGKGDIFGEMALFECEVRTATVRALGNSRILTIDQKNFMQRIYEDPSLAYRLLQTMSNRVRELNEQYNCFRTSQADQIYQSNPELKLHEKFWIFCKRWKFSIPKPVAWNIKFLPL